MKNWEVWKSWSDRKRFLSSSTIRNYVVKGYITSPVGPHISPEAEWADTVPGEIAAARALLPITGPSELKMAREIAMHVLGAGYHAYYDAAKDPALIKLIKGRTSPAFYSVAWLEAYHEFTGDKPPVDLVQLRVLLMSLASPPAAELKRAKAEWDAKDAAAAEERRLHPELDSAEEREQMALLENQLHAVEQSTPADKGKKK